MTRDRFPFTRYLYRAHSTGTIRIQKRTPNFAPLELISFLINGNPRMQDRLAPLLLQAVSKT